MKLQNTPESQNNPEEKKNNTGKITIPDFSITDSIYSSAVVTTVWYWHTITDVDQWNKVEYPKINKCKYSHLILHKDAKSTQ